MLLSTGPALIVTAAVAWVLASLGWRLGSVKGRQIVDAAGLSNILAPQPSHRMARRSWPTARLSWTGFCWCWVVLASCRVVSWFPNS